MLLQASLSLLLASTCFAALSITCKHGVLKRKEFRTLDVDARKLYLATMRNMHHVEHAIEADGTQPKVAFFDKMAKLHYDWKAIIHGNAQFLPWHRYFLFHVEQELQRVSNKPITLPFWDWSFDSQAPEHAPIFGDGDEHVGRNGDPADGCVKTGAFRDVVLRTPDDHCLKRKFNNDDKITALSSPELLAELMNVNEFKSFTMELESVPHGAVHVGVGGDMAVMTSPNDPVFFLHHAMVDKIWNDWQLVKSDRMTAISGFTKTVKTFNDPRADRLSKITPDSTLSIFDTVTVGDTFDTRKLCYEYERVDLTAFEASRNVPTSPRDTVNSDDSTQASTGIRVLQVDELPITTTLVAAEDRQELMKLRTPAPLPSAWVKANGLDEMLVRKQEDKNAKVIAQLNAKKDYSSPAALWNRDRILGKILEWTTTKKQTVFTMQKENSVKVELAVKSDTTKAFWTRAMRLKQTLRHVVERQK